MTRGITLIGAPSSIGIRPYDSALPRALDQAPAALRDAGLRDELQAEDAGDVRPEPDRDFIRPVGRARNEPEMVRYSAALADRIGGVVADGRFPLLLGGDCSVVLGALCGLRRAGHHRVGLAYLDGHADFVTVEESYSGSVASMCLAMTVGRGDTPLAQLAGNTPLVPGSDVALVGRRDETQPNYGQAALSTWEVLDLPHAALGSTGYADAATRILGRVAGPGTDGFWIHLDADVLSPLVMPAVDSPEPGGPAIDDLVPLLATLAAHPSAVGMEVTIYDPHLDPDRTCAARLYTLLARTFAADTGVIR